MAPLDDKGMVPDTPRARMALSRLGITPEELKMKRFADFYIPGDMQEKQKMRFTHYEQRRQEKVDNVLKERERVCVEELAKKNMPPGGKRRGLQNMGAMEALLDKEASRLEQELNQQLRYHQTVEQANEKQLDRERKLEESVDKRSDARLSAKASLLAKADMLKDSYNARKQNTDKLLDKIKDNKEAKLTDCFTNILNTEVRLKKFQADRDASRKEASDSHHAHLALMELKLCAMEKERDSAGEAARHKKEMQIYALTERKNELQKQRELQMCENHLKHSDVLERKHRSNRANEHSLNLVKEWNVQSAARIDRMLNLKTQVVEQRKRRLHAPTKFKAIDLRNIPLGPGQYDVNRDACLQETPATLISDAHIEKGHIMFAEMAERPTRDNPPPGTYDCLISNKGDQINNAGMQVAFTKGNFANFAEHQANLTRANPGPGRYDPQNETFHPTIGAKIKRPVFSKDDSEPPAWCEAHLSCTPGPAQYTVDEFTRKEAMMKVQRSLPSLDRALRTNPPGGIKVT